jgi:hypothetical protein
MSWNLFGQGFLLLPASLIAFVSARNLYRYYDRDPAERGTAQPDENRDWLNRQKPARNIIALIVVLALSIFIFTDAATDFARGPMFTPLLMVLLGIFGIGTVVMGLATGKIRPIIRHFPDEVDQAKQPNGFWLGMSWNFLLGYFLLIMGFAIMADVSRPKFADICSGPDSQLQSQETIAACSELAADPLSRPTNPPLLPKEPSIGLGNDPQPRSELGDEALAETWNSWADQPQSAPRDTSAAQ